jgi:hypothetical protein
LSNLAFVTTPSYYHWQNDLDNRGLKFIPRGRYLQLHGLPCDNVIEKIIIEQPDNCHKKIERNFYLTPHFWLIVCTAVVDWVLMMTA